MPADPKEDRFGATAADTVFVWIVWASMLAALTYFVARWSANAPNADDEAFACVLRGDEPVSAVWLWQTHNEHRLPLPKLIMLGLFRTSGGAWRSGMYYGVGVLGLAAAALIVAARRLRGWTAFADAFFPLVLLHWGNADTLLWGFGCTGFLTSTALSGLLLALVAWSPRPSAAAGLTIGVLLAALAFCGGTGLALVPALALWLAAFGLGDARRRAAALVGVVLAAAACAVMVAAYRPPADQRFAGLAATARTTVECLAGAWGAIIVPVHWTFWAGTVLALILLAVGALGHGLARAPGEEWRAAGLLAWLAAIGCLAAAVGLGRAEFGPYVGLVPRYATLMAPLPCAAFLAVAAYQRGRVGHWLQVALLLLAGFMVWVNAERGLFRAYVLQARPPTQQWN